MNSYEVDLINPINTIRFEADDFGHAEEQALDYITSAEPGSQIYCIVNISIETSEAK